MLYENTRPYIKTGDLIAIKGTSAIAKIVRFFTASEYSHVGMAWVVGGRVFIIEALNAGIKINPLSSKTPFYWIGRPKELNQESFNYALATVGQKYSIWQAALGYFNLLKIGQDKRWQCAEFIIDVLKKDGEVLICKPTPSALVQEVLNKWDSPIYYLV